MPPSSDNPSSQHRKRATRADMERAIRDGGSVMLPSGQIISKVEHLPGDADLADIFGDSSLAAKARQDAHEQIRSLHEKLERLEDIEDRARRREAEREEAEKASGQAPEPGEKSQGQPAGAPPAVPGVVGPHPALPGEPKPVPADPKAAERQDLLKDQPPPAADPKAEPAKPKPK